jgi:hypothetical protein
MHIPADVSALLFGNILICSSIVDWFSVGHTIKDNTIAIMWVQTLAMASKKKVA